jgi:hypothetical protein
MRKKIMLSVILAGILPAVSYADIDVSKMDLNGKIGMVGDTINDSYHNKDYFDKSGTRFGSYIDLGIKGNINDNLKVGVALAGLETLGYDNNIQGNHESEGVIKEAYLKYKTTNTIWSIGRSKFDSPLIFSDNYYPIENSFDFISVTNKSFKDVYLFGGLIFRANTVDDLGFKQISTQDGDENPVFVFGGLFTGIKQFPVQSWAYYQNDGLAAFYIDTTSKFTIDLNLALQYSYSTNEGPTDNDAINMLGANLSYDINSNWNADIAFNHVSNGDDINSPTNLGNRRSSKLYTYSRSVSEFMGHDESSLHDTDSFLISANGTLAKDYGNLGISFGSYHHSSGTSYNNSENTTIGGEISWSKDIVKNFNVNSRFGVISYEVLDASNKDDRQTGQYLSLNLKYSF